ncbi:hypothetical protein GCM10028803_21650 [Larkinella knui]
MSTTTDFFMQSISYFQTGTRMAAILTGLGTGQWESKVTNRNPTKVVNYPEIVLQLLYQAISG